MTAKYLPSQYKLSFYSDYRFVSDVSLWALYKLILGIFFHSSMQILSNSSKLDGDC